MTVKVWCSKNDANHKNRHAKVEGSDIEFFAFPYQSYSGSYKLYSAILGKFYDLEGGFHNVYSAGIYIVQLMDGHATGRTISVDYKSFATFYESVEWADKKLHELGDQ